MKTGPTHGVSVSPPLLKCLDFSAILPARWWLLIWCFEWSRLWQVPKILKEQRNSPSTKWCLVIHSKSTYLFLNSPKNWHLPFGITLEAMSGWGGRLPEGGWQPQICTWHSLLGPYRVLLLCQYSCHIPPKSWNRCVLGQPSCVKEHTDSKFPKVQWKMISNRNDWLIEFISCSWVQVVHTLAEGSWSCRSVFLKGALSAASLHAGAKAVCRLEMRPGVCQVVGNAALVFLKIQIALSPVLGSA